jgi:hypothetical protein
MPSPPPCRAFRLRRPAHGGYFVGHGIHRLPTRRPTGPWVLARHTCSPTCRNEGLAPKRIYAQECIIFHDSASVLTSQRQLLHNLLT